jgi:hypothetical protein
VRLVVDGVMSRQGGGVELCEVARRGGR